MPRSRRRRNRPWAKYLSFFAFGLFDALGVLDAFDAGSGREVHGSLAMAGFPATFLLS
jgi:hypothetical protein